jgi:hypothetical protein
VEKVPGGGTCVVLEGDFKEANGRLCWDWVGALDLAKAEAVSVEVRAENGGLAAHIGSYFGTPNGWYTRFGWGGLPDSWTKQTLPLETFGAEGTPDGWDKITRFRFSVWGSRPGHVGFRLRDLRALPRDPNRNFVRNGSFEVPGPLPYAWGSGHWGIGALPWAADMDLWRAHFGVDHTVAHDGKCSARVINGPGLPGLCLNSAWFNLPGVTSAEYKLSAWLRTDREGVAVKVQCGEKAAEATVGVAWQQVTLAGIPGGENRSLTITPSGECTLWVDSVQIQQPDASASAFHLHPDDGQLADREALVDWSPPRRTPEIVAGRVTRGAVRPAKVQIDASGRFLLDGEPYLQHSLGLESVSDLKMLDVVANLGFADVCIEVHYSQTTEELQSYFDRCAELGLRVIPWLDGNIPLERFRQHLTTLRHHPALLCWYVYDEPSGERFAEADARLSLAHELDPEHPALINYLGDKLTGHMGDIYSTDIYPIPWSAPNAAIQGVVTMAGAATQERKPVWMWLQGTGYAYWMDREPTPRELSCMVYGSLIAGARGIYYFAQVPRTKECLAEMRALCVELGQLEPVLGGLVKPPQVECDAPGVMCAAYRYEGETWVLAVNTRREPCRATLKVSDRAPGAEVVFEGRQVPLQRGAWTDDLGTYERHVYRLVGFR